MKLKSLFLGTAAGVMAVTGAQAADLTVTEPVEYVRVCDLYGTGYYYIPGTDTCLKVGGYVRFETRVNTMHDRADDLLGFFARGQVEFDARTQTEFGLLRSFIAIQANRGPGGASSAVLDKGYIQFAGLTAGYATSFFELSTGFNYDNPRVVSDRSLPLIAYTAAFGNGFSATLSLEDRSNRESGLLSPAGPAGPGFYTYGGQTMPDIVANLRVDQGWGTAQIMGAVHQIRGPVGFGAADSAYGFAVGAGVQINLPMLAPGDKILLEGTYVNGAVDYMNQSDLGPVASFIPAGVLAGTAVTPDAVLNLTGTDWKKTKGWGVLAGISHYWSPTLRSNLTGGYGQIDIPSIGPFDLDYDYWRVGLNTIWSPVAGLDIGVEALYTNYSYDASPALAAITGPNSPFDDSYDEWSGKLRIQRNF